MGMWYRIVFHQYNFCSKQPWYWYRSSNTSIIISEPLQKMYNQYYHAENLRFSPYLHGYFLQAEFSMWVLYLTQYKQHYFKVLLLSWKTKFSKSNVIYELNHFLLDRDYHHPELCDGVGRHPGPSQRSVYTPDYTNTIDSLVKHCFCGKLTCWGAWCVAGQNSQVHSNIHSFNSKQLYIEV